MSAPTTLAPARPAGLDHDAVRDIAPVVVGVAPFGVAIGVAMAEAGIDTPAGLASSFLLYGGSVQLAMLALVTSGSGVVTAALSAALINARLLLYGASLAPRFRRQPVWFRWIAPHFLVDQTAAIASARPELDDPRRFRRYWLTAAAVLTVGWLTGIGAGMTLGPRLPAHSPLEVTTAALFVALLMPRLRERPAAVAAGTACLATVAASGLPGGVGLILGIGAGVAAAVVTTRRGAPV